MSGSSLDGLDMAMVKFEGKNWELIASETFSLPSELKALLSDSPNQTALELVKTRSQFSKLISESLHKFIDPTHDLDCIGVHGHTICHFPELDTSWQLVNGAYLAATTARPVICDFRNQDLALGGQGTPMAVIADRDLFSGYDYYLNLGGIANISYRSPQGWVAYDLCPCNQLLNHISRLTGQEYDKDGQTAAQGKIHQALLQQLKSHPYYNQAPPKSIDNNWIRSTIIPELDKFPLSPADSLRTIVEFVTEVIANNVSITAGKMFITGGGTKNKFFIEKLEEKLALQNVELVIPSEALIDYKEAILIAYCSVLRIKKQPNFISSVTGASHDTIGGCLYLPPINTDT